MNLDIQTMEKRILIPDTEMGQASARGLAAWPSLAAEPMACRMQRPWHGHRASPLCSGATVTSEALARPRCGLHREGGGDEGTVPGMGKAAEAHRKSGDPWWGGNGGLSGDVFGGVGELWWRVAVATGYCS
jgi:hypothetical protein